MSPMHRRFLWIALLLAAGLIFAVAVRRQTAPFDAPRNQAANPAANPAYDNYDFAAPGANVVNIGIQPLWAPASTITELMRRDAVLAESLAALGLTLRFHPFLKGADMNGFLFRGKLAAMAAGDMPALTAAAESEVVVAALINQGFISILARRRMPMSALRGKTLGTAYGASAHFALLRALSGAGLAASEATFVYMDLAELPGALRDGRIDAFSAWEPGATAILTANPDFCVIHRVGYSGYLYFSGPFTAARPEAAKAVIAAQLRAMAWMRAKRENLLFACGLAMEAARRFSGSEPGVSAEQYAELVQTEFLNLVPVPIIPENALAPDGQLRHAFDFLIDRGLLPAASSWDKVAASFNRSLIRETLADPKAYRLGDFDYSLAAQ